MDRGSSSNGTREAYEEYMMQKQQVAEEGEGQGRDGMIALPVRAGHFLTRDIEVPSTVRSSAERHTHLRTYFSIMGVLILASCGLVGASNMLLPTPGGPITTHLMTTTSTHHNNNLNAPQQQPQRITTTTSMYHNN